MCGIAGFAGRPPRAGELAGALAAIRHRGPDGEGIFEGEMVGLAHARLSILDLSAAGSQPMVDEPTGVVLVFNGEIYNSREIRQQLGETAFRSTSDTETILRLYLRVGIQAVEALRGMFAFAIWDSRTGELHLARDRFGIKPLYLARGDSGSLTFASEAKALFAMGAGRDYDLGALHAYLAEGRMVHDERTFFRHVRALAPGTILTWRDGHMAERPFWTAGQALRRPSPPLSPGEVEERAWHLLTESVGLHLASDVPVGVSLSSGLDSQLILHALAALGIDGIHAFTFGFDDEAYDEIRRLDGFRSPVGLIRHPLRTGPEDMLPSLNRAIEVFEAPLGGLGTLSAWRLMETARRAGVPVVLCGEGADETFGGYRYYHDAYFRELYQSGEHARLAHELEAFTGLMGGVRPGPDRWPDLFGGNDRGMKAPDGTSLEGASFLGPALLDNAGRQPAELDVGEWPHLRAAMVRDMCSQKLPKLLQFQDRAGMAFGVETRVPFLDHPLVEFAYSLPSSWMIRDGAAKFIPKRLLDRFAGQNAAREIKHFVATPQREWIKVDCRQEILDRLDGGALRSSGLIDYDAFRAAYLRYADDPEPGNSFFVWKMLNLEAMLASFGTSV